MGTEEKIRQLLREAEEKGIYIQLTPGGVSIFISFDDIIGNIKRAFDNSGVPVSVDVDYEKKLVRFTIPMSYLQSLMMQKSPSAKEVMELIRALSGG